LAPLLVVGVGTAFAFIPISIAALDGVAEHEPGLASGLLYTSQELGGALRIAIASSITPRRQNDIAARRRHGTRRRKAAPARIAATQTTT
jgi:hypothetical protein